MFAAAATFSVAKAYAAGDVPLRCIASNKFVCKIIARDKIVERVVQNGRLTESPWGKKESKREGERG